MKINNVKNTFVNKQCRNLSLSNMCNKTIATSSNGTPNWNYIPSRANSNKSQQQFESEITWLAKNAANTTNKAELDSIKNQVLMLNTEYVSQVSPDRKQLYKEAENAVRSETQQKNNSPLGELTLLNLIMKYKGEKTLSDKSFSISGGSVSFAYNGSGYDTVIKSGGVNVLNFGTAGWSYEMTPAEIKKKDEFYAIYNKAYNAEKNVSQPLNVKKSNLKGLNMKI